MSATKTAALPLPGPVAVRAADIALAAVGVHEDGPPYRNRGQWVDQYLASVGLCPGDPHEAGEPWCAAAVTTWEHKAAHVLGVSLPSSFPHGGPAAAAATWAQWGKDNGRWIPAASGVAPQKGDLCCFDIASEGGIHHIGIVLSADASGVVTVEGNTHPEGVATRDGYCVAKRHRDYGAFGAHGGFVRIGV